MRNLWLTSLALSLGLLASATYAGDPVWRSAQPVALDRPVAVPSANTPMVILGSPILVGNSSTTPSALPIVDQQIRPTSYVAPASDPIVARPLPLGPSTTGQNPNSTATPKYVDNTPPPPALAPQPAVVQPDDPSLWWRFRHLVSDDGSNGCGCGDACGGDCCDTTCPYPSNRWYVSAEYLMWWFKGQAVPPLVTSGSIGDAIPGALNMPGTNTLFGGHNMENGAHSGARLMVGYWFCDDHALGFEAGYFFLGPSVTNFVASSNGTPILTRPFIDAATGTETTELIAGPNVLAGTVTVQTRSSMWGAEGNFKTNVCGNCNWNLDVLAGFKALGLNDDLLIRENLTVLHAPGGTFDIVDHFQTQNRFYGGQVGAEWEYRCGRWSFDIKSKLAIGATNQLVNISGNDLINDPTNGTHAYSGGLLAQQTNSGLHSRDMVTFVPEIGLTVGYNLTQHLRCFAGYTFLYWSDVARTGPQIDRTVNQNQIAPPIPGGPARPAFSFNGTDFWAQGVSVGLEYRW